MKTIVSNRHPDPRVRTDAVRQLCQHLAGRLQETDPSTVWNEITVVLTDDAGIQRVNHEFFGKNWPTDVICFRGDPIPGETGSSGDLLINVDCALREGSRRNGPDAELALYIAHGFNHLGGGRDDTPSRRAAMRRREQTWLSAVMPGLPPLFRTASHPSSPARNPTGTPR